MADTEIFSRSALQLGGMMGAGLIDAEAVTQRTLAAINSCRDKAIFTLVTPERAQREAQAASRRIQEGRPRSLLDGVPVAWKDLFDIAGFTTTAGSRVLASEPVAEHDAPVVARLQAAGMVCVGRVNMTEFAYSGIGLNPHFGTPRNPRGDGKRVPGGSSSGSAVSVARGLVPVSIGSDTGGSVRIPAAFNGIIGYKSSTNRYPTDGVFPLSRTLDTVGVLARGVADAVAVDAALRGHITSAVRQISFAGRRILVPTNVVFDDAEPAVVANFDSGVRRLEAAGAVIDRRALPVLDEILALTARHGNIAAAEAHSLHRARIAGPDVEQIDRRVLSRLRAAAAIETADYIIALHERRRMIAEFTRDFAGVVIAYPTVAHVAPSIAELEADDALFGRINIRTLRNTNLGNFLDWCGVTIPSGTDAAGTPTGLLLSGLHGTDDDILSLALSAEAILRDAP